ncbi:MAG: UDP-N-acetylmuramoyl-tripeptide--D-alanyl-D-alanine ligase [Candidatus Anoxychlamydiales bacterium]|nr:UDP-N-acetylmuramoyl-tripeptide--D-alanyl-D-alanine ligase [Candidatus Anoxychlamydiales bacterium]NGX36629.1 UDP-N-acetylmuramoyl-tripeptide--D-alanyl-D-alanine ligase [Candidatus Anoxychlamydiales bacterium]
MDKIVQEILKRQFTGYQIDSRLIKKGNIFFALKGEKTDGHEYLQDVANNKVVAAIIQKDHIPDNQSLDIELIRVDDVLSFLQSLAAEALKKSSAKIIAVTGTSGKTTTKEFIFELLSSDLKVSKTYESYNSQAGLPIAILNIDKNVDFLVLEMAMDEKNEIEKLIKIAPPDIALITQLASYPGDLKTIENLARGKKEIFSDKKTKHKLINKNMAHLKAFSKEKFLTFSIEDKKADFYFDIKKNIFYEMDRKTTIVPPFKETHLLENVTAAIAVCRLANASYENILKNLNKLKPVRMRFEKEKIQGVLFIKDYYNGNPDATIAALKNLPKNKGKKIAVLGTHSSYGILSNKVHLEILQIANKYVDEILCIGDFWPKNVENQIQKAKKFSTLKNIATYLKNTIKKDDVILIKGSRFLEMEKIFDYL